MIKNASGDRIREINDLEQQTGSKDFSPDNYDIGFRGVGFSYDSETKVLEDVSFVARQGR